eukprot:987610-Pyramimonas_sp.AAC.1
MARPLLLGLSLLQYNRAGGGLRLRRSCWLSFPTRFKLGSGAGLWWSALVRLLTTHGAIWWTTDVVEHQGAASLRGGVYTTTQHSEDTC